MSLARVSGRVSQGIRAETCKVLGTIWGSQFSQSEEPEIGGIR